MSEIGSPWAEYPSYWRVLPLYRYFSLGNCQPFGLRDGVLIILIKF